jgi:hypothetical protein
MDAEFHQRRPPATWASKQRRTSLIAFCGGPVLSNTDLMATIPRSLHEHIQAAFPTNVCLMATVLPTGYAQVTPRGSVMVYDDEHLATWERGRGSTSEQLEDGTKVTIFFRNQQLRQSGLLPMGGVARFYGVAELHRSGPIYERIWERLIEPEKNRDPEKKGYGVLIRVERAENLAGQPLADE